MKTIHTLALTTLATALAAGTAFAQEQTTPPTGQAQTQQDQWQTQQGQAQTAQDHAATQGQQHGREHAKGDKPSFDELNTRGDNRVTRADLAAHPRMLEKFDNIDADGDGSISRAEYEAWKARKDRDGTRPQN